MRIIIGILLACALCQNLSAQGLGLLKYNGGGDWYANPTALANLSTAYNESVGATSYVHPSEIEVERLLESGISFLHVTGHGRIVFSEDQRETLRQFTSRGGFIHVDDNYGMKDFVLEELPLIFPNAQLQRVALTHPVFNIPNKFEDGLPKIHEHDGEQPEHVGVFVKGELVALFTYECDLGDGWEDEDVHNDSQEKREKALKMGVNLVHWSIVRSNR